jgi:hypothetical protein
MVGLAPQRVPGVSGFGGSTALVHEQLLGNENVLKEVCAFIAREVSAKVEDDAGRTPAEDLKEANSICIEKAALGATSR